MISCGESQHVHQWGDPEYAWSGDNLVCTASRTCLLDSSHVEKEEAKSTYNIVRYASETETGLAQYSASFKNDAFAKQTKDVVLPTISVIDSFESVVNSVNTKHNYSVNMVNKWDYESEPWAEYNLYNINNDAIFDDLEPYFYSGYIKQKGQGIVTFSSNKSTTSTGLIVGSFVSTNLERSVSDVYPLALEHILDKTFTFVSYRNAYVCSDIDAISVIANMAFGDYVQLVEAPEDFVAVFFNESLIITSIFDVRYYDQGQEHHAVANVTLTVTNFEKTHNRILESYVVTPDYSFEAPTGWDDEIKEYFNTKYNGYYPPFIDGLSYSWKYGLTPNGGVYTPIVEDYYSGDLTSSYAPILVSEGFKKVSNPGYIEYQKIVEEDLQIHTYSVKMKYRSPKDKDASGMEYGYLYPNGVSTFIFLHTQKTKSTITDVAKLNEYISKTEVAGFLPNISLPDDTRVSGFKDATSVDQSMAIYLKGESSDFFNIYPETQEVALSAVEAFVNALKELGFEDSSSSMFQQYWLIDEYGSRVKITDPSYSSTWTSSSKLQVSIEITKETINHYEE